MRPPLCPMLMQGYYASPSRNGADWGLDPCACIGSLCAWWMFRDPPAPCETSGRWGYCSKNACADPYRDPAQEDKS
jgi:hypothetical protein